MAATSAREVLTCVAFSFYAHHGNSADQNGFENVIQNYYDGDDAALKPYLKYLSKGLSIDQIRKIKSEAKKGGNALTPLTQEILSAWWTAEVLHKTKKLYNQNFDKYVFLDQNDPTVKLIKDEPLKKMKTLLNISETVPADILSSIDVFMIQKDKIQKITTEIEKHILKESDTQILNNLAYGKSGKNTYRNLFNEFFTRKYMIPISLKKISSKDTKKEPRMAAAIEIVGKVNVNEDLKLLVDPYTEFLSIISEMKSKTELNKLIDEMVELEDEIRLGDTRTYFQVDFTLNYKKVNIANKIQQAYFEVGRTGFNGGKVGPQPWFGGASYSVTLPILKRYPKFSIMLTEMIRMRERAFDYAIDSKKAAKLKNYRSARNSVKATKLVLFNESDLIEIKEFCKEYDQQTKNPKDSYQEFRIALINLCKNRSVSYTSTDLRRLDKDTTKKDKNTSLQNQFAHSQGIWMYTRKGGDMKDFFKKQITLTLYGIMTKKGAKIFESSRKGMLVEDAFVKEITTQNSTKKLAKFLIAPHIIID
jgi:DNA-binding transcriptional MerR regulator